MLECPDVQAPPQAYIRTPSRTPSPCPSPRKRVSTLTQQEREALTQWEQGQKQERMMASASWPSSSYGCAPSSGSTQITWAPPGCWQQVEDPYRQWRYPPQDSGGLAFAPPYQCPSTPVGLPLTSCHDGISSSSACTRQLPMSAMAVGRSTSRPRRNGKKTAGVCGKESRSESAATPTTAATADSPVSAFGGLVLKPGMRWSEADSTTASDAGSQSEDTEPHAYLAVPRPPRAPPRAAKHQGGPPPPPPPPDRAAAGTIGGKGGKDGGKGQDPTPSGKTRPQQQRSSGGGWEWVRATKVTEAKEADLSGVDRQAILEQLATQAGQTPSRRGSRWADVEDEVSNESPALMWLQPQAAAKLAAKPAAKPAAQQSAKSAAQPSAKPVEKPVTRPVEGWKAARPAAKVEAKTEVKWEAKWEVKPEAKSEAKPKTAIRTATEKAWASAVVFSDAQTLKISMVGRSMEDEEMGKWCDWFYGYMQPEKSGWAGFVAQEVDFSRNALTSNGLRKLLGVLWYSGVTVNVLKLHHNKLEKSDDLVDWLADGSLAEAHLSHNWLDAEAGAELVLAAAAAWTDGCYLYPRDTGSSLAPLWLRLEQNFVDVAVFEQRVKSGIKRLGRRCRTLCHVDGTKGCTPQHCQCCDPAPVVHVPYLQSQQH